MIDIDCFLVQVLSRYRVVMLQTKKFVKNAFFACDLDGNGTINLNEFLTLYRHIEQEKFVLTKALKMFENYADIVEE